MANIYFKCSCGKNLAVDEVGAGRTVKCTDCGKPITVPQPEIECDCDCGKTMLAPKNMAGEMVQCVECNAFVEIPALIAKGVKPNVGTANNTLDENQPTILNKDTIKKIQQLSNVNLLRLLCENPKDYLPEAISFAKAEANRRGIGNIDKKTLQQFAQEETAQIEALKAQELAKSIPPPNIDLITLQAAADYLSYNLALKRMRRGAVGSIIFGIIALVMGLVGMQLNFLNGILVLIGLVLLVEGIWVVSVPKRFGILLEGITLILVALWNMVILGSWSVGNIGNFNWGLKGLLILAILQLVWGIESIKRYIVFLRFTPKIPTPKNATLINEMTNFVIAANPRQDKDILDFTQRCIPIDREWKGRLMNGVGLFVLGDGEDVLVARKDNVKFENEHKLTIRNAAIFRIGKRIMHGFISPESFQKYQEWASPELLRRRIQDSKIKMEAEAKQKEQSQLEFASRFPIGRYYPVLFKHFGYRVDRMSVESETAYAKRLQRFAKDYEKETGKRLSI